MVGLGVQMLCERPKCDDLTNKLECFSCLAPQVKQLHMYESCKVHTGYTVVLDAFGIN
jgi:hypothetical protein